MRRQQALGRRPCAAGAGAHALLARVGLDHCARGAFRVLALRLEVPAGDDEGGTGSSAEAPWPVARPRSEGWGARREQAVRRSRPSRRGGALLSGGAAALGQRLPPTRHRLLRRVTRQQRVCTFYILHILHFAPRGTGRNTSRRAEPAARVARATRLSGTRTRARRGAPCPALHRQLRGASGGGPRRARRGRVCLAVRGAARTDVSHRLPARTVLKVISKVFSGTNLSVFVKRNVS